jgi:hypothetical protein
MKLLHWLAIGTLALALASCGGTPIPAKPVIVSKGLTSNLNSTTANAKKEDIRGQASGVTTLMGFGRIFKAGAPLSETLGKALPQLSQGQLAATIKGVNLAKRSGLQSQAAGSPCTSGSIASPISLSTDADDDGIPVEVLIVFSNCVIEFGSPAPSLNGAIYIKDGNDTSATSSYSVIIDLTISTGANSLKLGLGVDYTAPSTPTGAHGFNFVVTLKTIEAGVTSDVGVSFNSTFQPTGGATDPFGNGTLNFTGAYSETEGGVSYGFNLTGTNLGITTTCSDFDAGTLLVADTNSSFLITYTGCGSGTYSGDATGTF